MNTARSPFLTWLITSLLAASGVFWAFHTGYAQTLFSSDFTHLTWGIAGIFILTVLGNGWLALKLQAANFSEDHDFWFFGNFKRLLRTPLFIAAMLPQLGYLGTLLGLIHMFQVQVGTAAITDAASIHNLMFAIGVNVGAALYPTFLGQMASMFVKTQIQRVSNSFDVMTGEPNA